MSSRIAIPLRSAQNANERIASSIQNLGQRTILLVEASDRDAAIAKGLLQQSRGYTFDIVRALSAHEAFGLMSHQNYDAVLISINTRSASEVEALGSLVRLRRQIPVVALTENDDARSVIKILRLGAKDCVAKSQLHSHGLDELIELAIRRADGEDLNGVMQPALDAAHPKRQNQLGDQWSWSLTKSRLISRNAGILLVAIHSIQGEHGLDDKAVYDRALWDLSQRIAEITRGVGTFARLQGGFVVILEGLRCKSEIDRLRNDLYGTKTLGDTRQASKTTYRVIAGGAIAGPERTEDFTTIRDRAAADLEDLKSLTVSSRVYEIVSTV